MTGCDKPIAAAQQGKTTMNGNGNKGRYFTLMGGGVTLLLAVIATTLTFGEWRVKIKDYDKHIIEDAAINVEISRYVARNEEWRSSVERDLDKINAKLDKLLERSIINKNKE